MVKISLGQRKITRVNYSHCVFLPPVLLKHLGLEADDFIEFAVDADGLCWIVPVKKEDQEAEKEKVRK